MSAPEPFTIRVPQDTLEAILRRVRTYEWHEMPEGAGWEYGTNLDYLRDFCEYWVNSYDWRQQEDRLNNFSHYRAKVDDLEIHFLHEKASGASRRPLLITHGWPGSFYEFLPIVGPLAHPEQFGGPEEDAFDVILPSLPGYAFSSKPSRPLGPRKVARLFDELATRVLGYDSYLAQGGDWGAAVTTWLGFDHSSHCRAIHLNMMGVRPGGSQAAPQTEEEKDWAERSSAVLRQEGAYLQLQSTRPQTLSYAMLDSPVGVAAWILEKFHAWSQLDGRPLEDVYSRDQLLTNIMLYIVTRTFNTATWMYRGWADEQSGQLPAGQRVEVPTAIAAFPGDTVFTWPPRTYVERAYHVTRWSDPPRGGHFAAMEQPGLFVDDLREWARSL